MSEDAHESPDVNMSHAERHTDSEVYIAETLARIFDSITELSAVKEKFVIGQAPLGPHYLRLGSSNGKGYIMGFRFYSETNIYGNRPDSIVVYPDVNPKTDKATAPQLVPGTVEVQYSDEDFTLYHSQDLHHVTTVVDSISEAYSPRIS